MSFDALQPDDQDAIEESAGSLACRRCRRDYPGDLSKCPFCGAVTPQIAGAFATDDAHIPEKLDRNELVSLSVTYAVLLLGSVLVGIVAVLAGNDDLIFPLLLAGDTVITVVVLWSWAYCRSVPSPEEETKNGPLAWGLGLPMLGLALLTNIAYHHLLTGFGLETMTESYVDLIGSFTWAFILICIQPALIEELFFRVVAWKCLRQHTGTWTTVAITSIMFGFCHIGAPLSIPVLIVVGITLGIARALSGAVWLPMLMHFGHNLVVLLMEV